MSLVSGSLRRFATVATLAALVACSSFRTPKPPASQGGVVSAQGALRGVQGAKPQVERADCFAPISAWAGAAGLECGWLIVPEVRERPNGPVVRLAFARLRAQRATETAALVYLHGGPEGPGIVTVSSRRSLEALSGGVRDVIVFDQRAVGLSEPKLCAAAGLEPRDGEAQMSSQERLNESARRCIANMRAEGRDPAGYTTPVAAADVRDLREALGYAQWDLYGVSYGGRLAFETMRVDPTGVRAVVVGSPAVPVIASGTEDPISVERALRRLFAACAAQNVCSAAFPTLERDFFAMYDSLARTPIPVSVMRGPESQTVPFDGPAYLTSIRCQLSSTRKLSRIPLLIHELRYGDRSRAASLLVNDCRAVGARGANAKSYLINCFDGYGPAYLEARRAVRDRVREMWWTFEEGGEECTIWQEQFADSAAYAPLRSDIPTLILTGEFDERTPTDHARRAAVGLTHAYLHEMPGEGHANPPSGCHAQIMQAFLANPTRDPDASCIAAIPPVAFATQSLVIPNLTFVVTTDANGARFAGQWEAELTGAARPFSVEMSIEGARLQGMWNPNRLELLDGRVGGDTLSFRLASADGTRAVTFVGVLRGDEIAFTRDVVAPPGAAGAQGVFGLLAVRSFVATRAQ